MSAPTRIGLIVPSSNVTVETEMPMLLGRHRQAQFSFHASRMRMHTVSPEQLRGMNAQRERCVLELGDAGVDAMLYACLVAVMVGGPGEHRRVESMVGEQLAAGGSDAAVLSSAGALTEALHALQARRIALVTPYVRELAQQVVGYLEAEEFAVGDWRALEVASNAEVAGISGTRVLDAARELDLTGVDALVISACVQMPSLDLIAEAEAEFGIPVLSAATAGTYTILRRLNLPIDIPEAGSLLRADALIPAESTP